MSSDRENRMVTKQDLGGKFGYQPIEKRGHQPVAASPRDVSPPAKQSPSGQASSGPPSQGSSAKK